MIARPKLIAKEWASFSARQLRGAARIRPTLACMIALLILVGLAIAQTQSSTEERVKTERVQLRDLLRTMHNLYDGVASGKFQANADAVRAHGHGTYTVNHHQRS